MVKNPAAVALGKLGRAANTEAQQEASRKNGRLGGRPPLYRCGCGATGTDLTRYDSKYRCLQCGTTGELANIGVGFGLEGGADGVA